MHSWKKKLVVSQLALACTLAIASQANATKYDTFGYHDDANTAYSWDDWTVDDKLNYISYHGYIYNNAADGAYDQTFNNDVVNGVLSTYYMNHDYANGTSNTLDVKNSTIHGMITSKRPIAYVDDAGRGYTWNNGTNVDYKWHDGDIFTLNIENSTIDDDYEYFYFTDKYLNGEGKTASEDYRTVSFAAQGLAVTMDVESNINISNNSRVAGIAMYQGDTANADYTTESHTWDNNIKVTDSAITAGSFTALENEGTYGNSHEPNKNGGIALSFMDNSVSDYAMKNNVSFSNSTLTGDVVFTSSWNDNFDATGHATVANGDINTNGGWADDGLNVDELNITLDNGSKWSGAARFNYEWTSHMYDVASNSLEPDSVKDKWGNVIGNETFQSGVFDVTLNNGSHWNITGDSNLDDLTVNNGSHVDLANSNGLEADNITLKNGSAMNLKSGGHVETDHLTVDSYSKVDLNDETTYLYANTITVSNGGEFSIGAGAYEAKAFDTNIMELTKGGVFNINSSDYVLDADLVNSHTNTTKKSDATYGYGVIAMNSDGHLTINGNGNLNNADQEFDLYDANDDVVAAKGNYKVRIDNSTGAGRIADYKGKELIYVNDKNTTATFSAANKADLGAYTYQAEQKGNTVVMRQMELTDYANMALSIPSANTNIWNLQQDTLSTRLTNGRHGLADNGGAWVSYFGGSLNGDNGVINYDQDVSGIMVGVDTFVDGNNAKWIVGAAAGFAKGDVSDRSGKVDQDSQSAYIYSSARFTNNIFLDGNLSYSRFDNDLSASMSNGQYVDGDSSTDAWGFGLKLGYDWKVNDKGYVTPYAGISGLFQSGDNFRLSNNMKAGDQDYDSLRYELGVNTGYTFSYGSDQALTPYFNLAYVYDDSNNTAKVNGDSIDNGVEGSAVRVGLGTQFSFTKNFSAYTDVNYLGGGDVEQDWGAKVGVKYTW